MPRVELIQANISEQDDIQDIERNILTLSREFIFPIDRIRSNVRPQKVLSKNTQEDPFDNINVDTTRPLESRAHAFYRLIGFPVLNPDNGTFYNPGFGRSGFIASLNAKKRASIVSGFNSSSIKNLSDLREDYVLDQRSIFDREDFVSAFYALTLTHIRPFQPLNDSIISIDEDQQQYSVAERDKEISDLRRNNPGLSDKINAAIGEFGNFSDGVHYLRPFVVDPRIDNTVDTTYKSTANGKSKLVGVPFLLSQEARQVEPNIFVTTPILEEIILARLSDTVEDKAFLDDVRKILENENTPGADLETLDSTTLKNTVSALLDTNSINAEAIPFLQGITKTEVIQLTRLIKIIRVLVLTVQNSIRIIGVARSKINWIPLPGRNGPELGAVGATLFRDKGVSLKNTIDQNIAYLQVQELQFKKSAGQGVVPIGGSSNFTSVSNSSGQSLDTIIDQRKKAVNQRNRIASNAFGAMGDIEKIMGETTGLGLIDVVAVHAALWSMNLTDILGFLDEESINRLQSIPGLNTNTVENREQSIISVMEAFERQLVNIFSFAQILFDNKGSIEVVV